MDAVARFAAEATLFCNWAASGTDAGADAARNGLLRVTRLYLAALNLPPTQAEDADDQPDAVRVGDAEWRAVYAACGRLPLDYYGAVSDPLPVPPEHPVVGSLGDDLADIYRDVVAGLREFEAGRRKTAAREWESGFRQHWGAHAAGAIGALHAWLAENAPDLLSVDAILPQADLTFSRDGNDLIAETRVGANNSPHVLWTRAHVSQVRMVPPGGGVADAREVRRVSLHYYVFQNSDLYYRSLKLVDVSWRLPGHEGDDWEYEVVETFDPDSAELRKLLPKLEALSCGGGEL